MRAYNAKNERLKRQYYDYLKEADGKAEATINGVRKALSRFENYTGYRDFATFNKEHAMGFKKRLGSTKAERTNQPLGKSTILSTLNILKDFFRWLVAQPGYRSKIQSTDIHYLSMAEKDIRAAKAPRFKEFPTLDQIRRAIEAMPTDNDIRKRNRALMAFLILTGIRDTALVSLKLKHIDLDRKLVKQDPSEVKTKFSKGINTYFFPVGDDLSHIVIDWVQYLLKEKLYDFNSPLFPRTLCKPDANHAFAVAGIEPEHWNTTQPVRDIVKQAFTAVGLKYYNPHSFRNTLVQLGQQRCKTPEEYKAWSQNLGHENVLTTFTSYGQVDTYRQGDIIHRLRPMTHSG